MVRWPPAAFAAVLLLSLLVRCDCCPDDDEPSSKGDRVSHSSYVGVGGACRDDHTGGGSYGCESTAATWETCAPGLACCPAPASSNQYECVASDRCGTTAPGYECESDRDCVSGYYCTSGYCRAPLGADCWDSGECITGYCNTSGQCDYPPHDAWVPPPSDAGGPDGDASADADSSADADQGSSPELGAPDQGAPDQGTPDASGG